MPRIFPLHSETSVRTIVFNVVYKAGHDATTAEVTAAKGANIMFFVDEPATGAMSMKRVLSRTLHFTSISTHTDIAPTLIHITHANGANCPIVDSR